MDGLSLKLKQLSKTPPYVPLQLFPSLVSYLIDRKFSRFIILEFRLYTLLSTVCEVYVPESMAKYGLSPKCSTEETAAIKDCLFIDLSDCYSVKP